MQRNRAMAGMFLLGALLTGGALGFTGSRVLGGGEPVVRWGDQASMRDYVATRLELSEGQRQAMDSLLDDRYRAMRQTMEPLQPRLDSIRLASRAKIRAMLSPTQQERFDALVREQEARRDSSRARAHGRR